MEITRKQFEAYEAVRSSGVTNMWAVNVVMDLSGLTREQCLTIIQTYEQLMEKYPGVRKD